MRAAALLPFAALAACATILPAPPAPNPQQIFFARLGALCGRAYQGRVMTRDAADREMAASRLVIEARCAGGETRIPFHVGTDRSRVWLVTRTATGLRLKHIHRHRDGTEDVRSRYGGDSTPPGSARRQDFPADAYSRDLFVREDIPESITNVWALEIEPGRTLTYELRRPGRHFRVEFDLTRPIANPPPPWGER